MYRLAETKIAKEGFYGKKKKKFWETDVNNTFISN